MCLIDTATAGTCGSAKHPDGKFQRPVQPTASEIASKHRHTRLIDQLMDINRSAEPRVPWIKHITPFGNVGVLAFSCTTLSDRTAQRWSRKIGPVVKVDRMTKETIRNDKEKDAYARVQGEGRA